MTIFFTVLKCHTVIAINHETQYMAIGYDSRASQNSKRIVAYSFINTQTYEVISQAYLRWSINDLSSIKQNVMEHT